MDWLGISHSYANFYFYKWAYALCQTYASGLGIWLQCGFNVGQFYIHDDVQLLVFILNFLRIYENFLYKPYEFILWKQTWWNIFYIVESTFDIDSTISKFNFKIKLIEKTYLNQKNIVVYVLKFEFDKTIIQ